MSRARGEEGWALLTTMGVLILMLSMGMTLASIVDTQTDASKAQRQRDSAFNLAESVLSAQVFSLARDWPGAGQGLTPYTTCTQTSTGSRCPDTAIVQGQVAPDVQAGASWQTSVHDNDAAGGQAFYSDALITARPGYDVNRDGRVWVRAAATAKGRTRTLVALVAAEQQEEPIPQAALIAARLEITNNGNKTLIAANGGLVAVRCTPLPLTAACLGHAFPFGKHKNLGDLTSFLATQISGTVPMGGQNLPAALTPEARARLRARAVADGTWFASCPTDPQKLTGSVVYIEGGNCSYTGNSQFNSAAAPGLLIMNTGTVSFGGTTNFFGIVYAANASALTTAAVETQGNAQITGGVLIDGPAGMLVGSSGLNITFDPNAFRAARSYGSAGVLQNTWREIRTG